MSKSSTASSYTLLKKKKRKTKARTTIGKGARQASGQEQFKFQSAAAPAQHLVPFNIELATQINLISVNASDLTSIQELFAILRHLTDFIQSGMTLKLAGAAAD